MAEVLRLAETFPAVFRDFALMGFNVALGKGKPQAAKTLSRIVS
jgi:hypothetical protein